jgi:DNA polymerase epsilon subunit 4
MDDDDETGPLDLTGSDILPPLAHSTNPLFPNAIVKKPSNTHSRAAGVPPASGAGGGAAATKASKAAAANEEREAREAKERERRNAVLHAGPSVQTKPFGAKNAPVSSYSLRGYAAGSKLIRRL